MRSSRSLLWLTLTAVFFCAVSSAQADEPTQVQRVHRDADGFYQYDWATVQDSFVRDTPLRELSAWLHEQWRDKARAISDARERDRQAPSTSFCHVISSFPSVEPLTGDQWNIIAERLGTEMKTASGKDFAWMTGFAVTMNSVLVYKSEEASKISIRPILDTAASRLDSRDHDVVKHAAILIGYFKTTELEVPRFPRLLDAAERIQDTKLLESIVSSISSYGVNHGGYADHDERAVRVLVSIINQHPGNRPLYGWSLSAISYAYGAPEQAAQVGVDLLGSPNPIIRKQSARLLISLCSFWNNKSEESRTKALAIALPAFSQVLRGDDDKLIADICGFGASLGHDAAPLVDDLMALLDHRNSMTREMTINSLAEIGQASTPALPQLREMTKADNPIGESARRALYMIAQEGHKPAGHDDHVLGRKKARNP